MLFQVHFELAWEVDKYESMASSKILFITIQQSANLEKAHALYSESVLDVKDLIHLK